MSDDASLTTAAQNEYRIEKLRHSVSVVFTSGTSMAGEMFLAARARFRSEAEEPIDVLNDDSPFFPLRVEDGGTILVSKRQVALIEAGVPEGGEDAIATAQAGIEVRVVLSQGTMREGTLFPETSRERPRLLDFLNAYQEPFLQVYGQGTQYLINREQIAHVRALT